MLAFDGICMSDWVKCDKQYSLLDRLAYRARSSMFVVMARRGSDPESRHSNTRSQFRTYDVRFWASNASQGMPFILKERLGKVRRGGGEAPQEGLERAASGTECSSRATRCRTASKLSRCAILCYSLVKLSFSAALLRSCHTATRLRPARTVLTHTQGCSGFL